MGKIVETIGILIFELTNFMCIVWLLKNMFCEELKITKVRLLMAGTLIVLSQVLFGNYVGSLMTQGIVPGILIVLSYKGKGRCKVLYVFPAIYLLSVTVTCLGFLMKSMNLKIVFTNAFLKYIVLSCSMILIIAYFYYRIHKEQIKIHVSVGESILIIVLGRVLIYLFGIFNKTETSIRDVLGMGQVAYSLIQIILAGMGITFCLLLLEMKSRMVYKEQKYRQEIFIKMQQDYFENYKCQQMETRKFKHDFNHHLVCINALIEQENYIELQNYMKQICGVAEKLNEGIYSGNDMIDAIINSKMSLMKEENIQFGLEGKWLSDTKIDSMDICTLVSNALSNAIDANLKIDKECGMSRWIKMQIKNTEYFLVLSFENVAIEQKQDGMWITDKVDYRNHGFGINLMKSVTDKYQGDLKLTQMQNRIKLEISLPR